ncbi:MAG: TolC family protein [Myxococcota bacterium]
MVWLLASSAFALTLDEVVARAGEVNPYAVASDLEWRKLRMEAAERWSLLSVTPEVTLERRWVAGTVADEGQVKVTAGLLNVPGWFDALEQSAQARSYRHVSEATALDAQYAAAVLYFEALAAEGMRDAALQFVTESARTLEATRARVQVGMDSEIMLRTAEVQALEAGTALQRAESGVRNSRARLARAIEQEVDTLVPVRVEPPPAEPARSPWIEAQRELTTAAHMEHAQSWSELLPTAELQVEAPIGVDEWTVTLQGTWTIDGAGPFLRARASALAIKQSEVLVRGLQLDHDLWVETGREDARSLGEEVTSARARVELSIQTLAVGQARLIVGLMDTLDVIKLQEDVVDARVDQINAELEEAYAVLEARRLAGTPW